MVATLRAALLALLFATPLALPAVQAVEPRDGAHDFDFKLGTWKTHIRRLRAPLTGSTAWYELDGTVTVRPVFGGRGYLEEIDARGGDDRFEGLTMFLYDDKARQWSMNFSNVKTGRVGSAPFGEFKDGRGVFYDRDTVNGREVLVRIVWSDITRSGHTFEQSFSPDGGATWEPNFVAHLVRVPS